MNFEYKQNRDLLEQSSSDNVKTIILNMGYVEDSYISESVLFHPVGFANHHLALHDIASRMMGSVLYNYLYFAESHLRLENASLEEASAYCPKCGKELFPIVGSMFVENCIGELLRATIDKFGEAYAALVEDGGWYPLRESLRFANPFCYKTYSIARAPEVLAYYYMSSDLIPKNYDELSFYIDRIPIIESIDDTNKYPESCAARDANDNFSPTKK